MGQDIIKSYVNSNDAIHALAENFIAFTDAEIKRTDSCIVGITGGTVINGLL